MVGYFNAAPEYTPQKKRNYNLSGAQLSEELGGHHGGKMVHYVLFGKSLPKLPSQLRLVLGLASREMFNRSQSWGGGGGEYPNHKTPKG